eukprot:NODE_16851_length_974_cov_3.205431.p1 GENE.NODE_16851_length_974_cov_3.205431~~NODE_16851_length_974_cov_3.205431.p1  ORF type:complete len:232 (+),score=72.48 NODE_16851_length_974_cov_3.205431:138-833(+)
MQAAVMERLLDPSLYARYVLDPHGPWIAGLVCFKAVTMLAITIWPLGQDVIVVANICAALLLLDVGLRRLAAERGRPSTKQHLVEVMPALLLTFYCLLCGGRAAATAAEAGAATAAAAANGDSIIATAEADGSASPPPEVSDLSCMGLRYGAAAMLLVSTLGSLTRCRIRTPVLDEDEGFSAADEAEMGLPARQASRSWSADVRRFVADTSLSNAEEGGPGRQAARTMSAE